MKSRRDTGFRATEKRTARNAFRTADEADYGTDVAVLADSVPQASLRWREYELRVYRGKRG